MKKILRTICNIAFAVAIAVALSFGAAEALSGTAHRSLASVCTYPDYCDTNEFCEDLCIERDHFWGWCIMSKNCCSCVD